MAGDPERTANLDLPYLMGSQAQKHVTHNEALRMLDALVQLSVVSRSVTAPPATPAEGDRYIVPAGGTGTFAGHADDIAAFMDGAWFFFAPQPGWLAYVEADAALLVYADGAWVEASGAVPSALNDLTRLGLGTAADAANPFAAKLNAALWTALPAGEGGSGDLRFTFNKETAADTGSLVFQTGYSGRAEIGLAGDDDLSFKVSADGATFRTGLVIDKDDGTARFPMGITDPNTGLATVSLIPAVIQEIWRIDTLTSAPTPRTYTIASVSGSAITLTASKAGEIYSDYMRDQTMVRIWNTSKTPAEPAWVNYNNAANQINVANAADIATWAAGETIQLGDPNPTVLNTLGMIALDISNYMFNNYGVVWRQKGMLMSNQPVGVGGTVGMDLSASGALGSAFGSSSNTDGSKQSTMQTIFTSVQSPISNSNLLFVRETMSASATGLGSSRIVRIVGIYV